MSSRIASKLLAEFIGTLSFVFIAAGAAAVVGGGAGLNGIVAVAFAHGLAFMDFAFAYRSSAGRAMSSPLTVDGVSGGAAGDSMVMGGAFTGAPCSPARALGPMVATGNFNDAWLYLTAPIVGAIVAALLHTGLSRLAQEGTASERGRAAQTPAE